MKKISIILIVSITSILHGHAQIEKGTLLLGGQADIEFSTTNNSYFYLNPNTGFFLTDNICLGLSMPIVFTNTNMRFGFSPFGRYYLNSQVQKSLFFSAALEFTEFFPNTYSIGAFPVSTGVGYVWLINNIGLETELLFETDFSDINIKMLAGFHIYFNNK